MKSLYSAKADFLRRLAKNIEQTASLYDEGDSFVEECKSKENGGELLAAFDGALKATLRNNVETLLSIEAL